MDTAIWIGGQAVRLSRGSSTHPKHGRVTRNQQDTTRWGQGNLRCFEYNSRGARRSKLTSHSVRMLSKLRHRKTGHIVNCELESADASHHLGRKSRTLTSTRPRPKSSPPGNRQTTSSCSPEAPASRRMISPARGDGASRILAICLRDS